MAIGGLVITNKGNELAAQLLAGTTTASFTKIVTSGHDYSGCDLKMLEGLEIKQETLVSQVEREEAAVVTVYGSIDAEGLTEGYYIQAVGLYAKDAEGMEILYAVARDEHPKYLAPYDDGSRILSGATFKLHVRVDNADQVSIEVDSAAVPSLREMQELRENSEKIKIELSDVKQSLAGLENASAKGEGLTFFVDADGILNVTYDDGEEGTENETDNPSS